MPKVGQIREDERGRKFIWKESSGKDGGWWSQIEDEEITENRVPWTCPCCAQMLDIWSTSFYNKWGVCSNCYYDFLHNRENLPQFKTNKDRAEYCKEKFNQKNKGK